MNANEVLAPEVQLLYEIIRQMNSGLDRHQILSGMLEKMVRALGYRAASLRLIDQEKQELVLEAAFDLSSAYLQRGPVRIPNSPIEQAVLSGEIVTVEDVRSDERFAYPQAAEREGLASMMAVPLSLPDLNIGSLRVYTDEPRAFAPQEQSLVSIIANLSAQIIHRFRLNESFRQIARQVNSSLEIQEVLRSLLEQTVSVMNVRAGSIRLLDPKKNVLFLAASYGLSEAYLKKGEVSVEKSPVDLRVLQTNEPVAVADVHQEQAFQYMEEAQQEGIRSVLVLPLNMQEKKIGVMRLYSSQARRFIPEEITFASAIAELGATAIENARLHSMLKERFEALKGETDGWYRFLTMS